MNRFRLLPRPAWWGTCTARLSGLAAIGLASFVVSSVPALPAQAATQTASIKISLLRHQVFDRWPIQIS
jgi:hypothetical protein